MRPERDLIVTFHPPGNYHYDRDNLIASTKAYQDGIADALGCDDHTFRPAYNFAEPVKGGKIIVQIEAMF
jgi:crossover junction endodeoxyribonuclease RusA